jgi:endonuclease/exonuclease/phosphatase family metal-dependent hydrolase
MTKRGPRFRVRTLIAAALVIALGAVVAARREPDAHADAPPRSRPRPRGGTHSHHAHREVPPASPWASRDACLAALKAGGSERRAGGARIGAWNLHWFPDGRPGDRPSARGADLDWLACAVAWMRVDVLAVEEIKRPPRGTEGLDALTRKLDGLTFGTWRSLLDDCPEASGQHVGLLYDSRHVKLVSSATIGELNPRGEPCKDELRPGLAGYFTFPGGLDLSVVAAHLKSGSDARALEERARSFAAFADAVRITGTASRDRDVLLLGDMNTMGCEDCEPSVTFAAELARTDAIFAGLRGPVTRVPPTIDCSHHYKKTSALLDWAAKSDLGELPAGARVVISGACGELGCDALSSGLASQEQLSDHCPIWLDLDDVDRD